MERWAELAAYAAGPALWPCPAAGGGGGEPGERRVCPPPPNRRQRHQAAADATTAAIEATGCHGAPAAKAAQIASRSAARRAAAAAWRAKPAVSPPARARARSGVAREGWHGSFGLAERSQPLGLRAYLGRLQDVGQAPSQIVTRCTVKTRSARPPGRRHFCCRRGRPCCSPL